MDIKWNMATINLIQRRFEQSVVTMAYDIANRARINAPVLTGNLRASIRVQPSNRYVDIVAGGNVGGAVVPYALRREFENRLHPSTTHYMGRAFDNIMSSDWKTRYFGRIAE